MALASYKDDTVLSVRSKRQASVVLAGFPAKRQRNGLTTPSSSHEFSDEVSSTSSHTASKVGEEFTPASTPATVRSEPKHWRPLKYSCTFDGCDRVFDRPCRLEQHLRSHNDVRPFECAHEGCQKSYLREEHLERHVRITHTKEVQRDYKCSWQGCDKAFHTSSRRNRHEKGHEQKERFKCTGYPPCDAIFQRESTLYSHINVNHLNIKPWPCKHINEDTKEECQAGYMTEAKLNAHMAKMHDDSSPRHICTLCPVQASEDGEDVSYPAFETVSILKAHISEVHKPVCDYCGIQCASARSLQAHIDQVHIKGPKEPQVFRCSEPGCTKEFRKRHNLKQHVRGVHLGLKPFVCGDTDVTGSKKFVDDDGIDLEWDGVGCGARLSSKASLESHIRTQHLGLKSSDSKEFFVEMLGRSDAKSTDQPFLVNSKDPYGDDDMFPLGMPYMPLGELISEGHPDLDDIDQDKFWIGGLTPEGRYDGGGDDDDDDGHSQLDIELAGEFGR